MLDLRICAVVAALCLLLFPATGLAGFNLSEAVVLERFGRLDVPNQALESLAAELEAGERRAARGTPTIRYAGPGCAYSTIQAAIHASADGDVVRVVSGTYNEGLGIMSKDIELVGGFQDCSAQAPSGLSIINRGGSGLGMDIFYPAAPSDPVREVVVQNFRITGGGGSGFNSGGVIVEGLPGRFQVRFVNVQITGNERDSNGGGLRILSTGDSAGFAPFVTVDNESVIANNVAGEAGGGVFCFSGFNNSDITMLRMGMTPVYGNEATHGGGLAVNGCENVTLYNGGPIVFILPTGGFIGNSATGNGGGIHVSGGGNVRLRSTTFAGFGDPDEAGLILGNSAQHGGGAFVTGSGSLLTLESAYTVDNSATIRGGGFSVQDGGRLKVARDLFQSGPCEPVQSSGGVASRPPCSVIEDNQALGGGALDITGDSSAYIYQTFVRGNSAGGLGGPIVLAENSSSYTGPDTEVEIISSVMHDNSGGFGVSAINNAVVDILFSTIAANPVTEFSASAVQGSIARVNVKVSIVEAGPTMTSMTGAGDALVELRCVIGDLPLTSFPAATIHYSLVDPEFIDPDNRDYRLGPTSPAIDYCNAQNTPSGITDIHDNERGVTWNGPATNPAPNPFPHSNPRYDLGAYEMTFAPLSADLVFDSDPPGQGRVFIDDGESVEVTTTLTNTGPNPAFGPIDVIDDFSNAALLNETWTCIPPSGVTCSPASGSGDVSTTISSLEPGQQVGFVASADLSQPGLDQQFGYTISAFESQYNFDSNTANNTLQLEITTGLFADGFE